MPPSSKKRSAPPTPGVSTRSSKVAKTDDGDVSTKPQPKGKKGKKVPAASAFKKTALPLHVHVTHTPPSAEVDPSKEAPLSKDVGHITSMTLLASDFSTGSYGWKGTKKATVELVGSEGKAEKVLVQFSINATVVGSKDAEDEEDAEIANGAEEHKEDAKANGDDAAQVEAEVAVEEQAE